MILLIPFLKNDIHVPQARGGGALTTRGVKQLKSHKTAKWYYNDGKVEIE